MSVLQKGEEKKQHGRGKGGGSCQKQGPRPQQKGTAEGQKTRTGIGGGGCGEPARAGGRWGPCDHLRIPLVNTGNNLKCMFKCETSLL